EKKGGIGRAVVRTHRYVPGMESDRRAKRRRPHYGCDERQPHATPQPENASLGRRPARGLRNSRLPVAESLLEQRGLWRSSAARDRGRTGCWILGGPASRPGRPNLLSPRRGEE